MTEEQFERFLADAQDELEARQSELKVRFDIGNHERFFVDYQRCLLVFWNGDAKAVEAEILPVLTHVPEP